jgi:RNA polymerase sigma factor (sigma-70 family)
MLRLAFLLCGDADLAKDLVQETFTKMYVAWPRIRDKERLRAYARVTMARELHTWRRRRRVGFEIPVDVVPDHAGCDEATSLEDSGALIAALLSLTPRERLAIVLRYYEQLS